MNEHQLNTIRDMLGAHRIEVVEGGIEVDDVHYAVIDDVVILSHPSHHTPYVRARLGDERAARPARGGAEDSASPLRPEGMQAFAEDIQNSFGAEWTSYGEILPEHELEFGQYFDLVDPESLRGRRVCDLGCGSGRWSYFLKDIAGELVLIDFSDAIFVARRNLADVPHAVFFMADLMRLPLRDDCAEFAFSLGVLHHLPAPCLDVVRQLRRLAPRILVYLYYALDNRPLAYRWLLGPVSALRGLMSRVHNPSLRHAFAWTATWTVYGPMLTLGRLLAPLGLASRVPLHDYYRGKSAARIEQDVYDRFFTGIEQRVSRTEIRGLLDTYASVTISNGLPYWHFLCGRTTPAGD